jgi:hypothetical protein
MRRKKMSKEELKKEAEEWIERNKPVQDDWEDSDIIQAIVDTNKERERRIAELEKENAELKDFIMQSKKDGISPINALIIKNLGNQLTKAKEIIKKFSEFVNNGIEYDPEHPQEHTDLWNELCEQAEQFLNGEVEK